VEELEAENRRLLEISNHKKRVEVELKEMHNETRGLKRVLLEKEEQERKREREIRE